MITHTEEVKEYREDGSLKYECTMAFLYPESKHLYDRRLKLDGKSFIRINQASKYRTDGTLEWRLIYNDQGEVIGSV